MGKVKITSYPHNVSKETYNELFEAYFNSAGVELTATTINNILSSAFDGYSRDQASVFRNVIEKESTIGAHLQTRKLAVSGLPWSIVGDNPEKNQAVEDLLNKAGINQLMNHLLEVTGYGYAGAFIQWGKGGGSIVDFPIIDNGNWEFDEYGNPFLIDQSGQRNELSKYNNNIIYHEFNAKSGVASTRGLCRTLIWTYFFKLFAFRHKARFLEKYGIPFILAKLDAKDYADEDTRDTIKTNLRNIGADGIGVFTEKTSLESMNAGAQGTNADFQGWLNYLDQTITLLILGQIASAGPTGGMSEGQIQDSVRRDLVRSDAKGLQETINNQVLRPLEWFKYATSDLQFIIDAEPPADLKQKAEMVTALNAAGYKPQVKWVEEIFNIPLEEQEATPAGGVPPVPGAPVPGAPVPGLAGLVETEDNPTDAVAFDESIDEIINQSTLSDDLKAQVLGKTAKETVSILNSQLLTPALGDDLKKNTQAEISRVRDAVEVNIQEALTKAEEAIPEEIARVKKKIEDTIIKVEPEASVEEQPATKEIIPALQQTNEEALQQFIEKEKSEGREVSEEDILMIRKIQLSQSADDNKVLAMIKGLENNAILNGVLVSDIKEITLDIAHRTGRGAEEVAMTEVLDSPHYAGKQAKLDMVREKFERKQLYGLDIKARRDISNDPEFLQFLNNIFTKGKRANQTARLDALAFDAMDGTIDIEDVLIMKRELDKVREIDPVKADNWATWLLHATTDVLPAMVKGIGQGLIAQQAGIPAPVGSGQYWYRQGAGSMYMAQLEQGVDENIAKYVARGAGLPYAALEFLQVRRIAPWLHKSARTALAKSAREVAANFAKRYGKGWITEVGQEVAQEFIQIVAEEGGKALTNLFNKDKNLQHSSFGRMFSRLWETTWRTFLTMPLIILPGQVSSGRRDIKIKRAYETLQAQHPELEPVEVQQILDVQTSNLKEASTTDLDAMLRDYGLTDSLDEDKETKIQNILSDTASLVHRANAVTFVETRDELSVFMKSLSLEDRDNFIEDFEDNPEKAMEQYRAWADKQPPKKAKVPEATVTTVQEIKEQVVAYQKAHPGSAKIQVFVEPLAPVDPDTGKPAIKAKINKNIVILYANAFETEELEGLMQHEAFVHGFLKAALRNEAADIEAGENPDTEWDALLKTMPELIGKDRAKKIIKKYKPEYSKTNLKLIPELIGDKRANEIREEYKEKYGHLKNAETLYREEMRKEHTDTLYREEMLAEYVQDKKLRRGIIQKVKRWIEKTFGLKLSNSEVDELLKDAFAKYSTVQEVDVVVTDEAAPAETMYSIRPKYQETLIKKGGETKAEQKLIDVALDTQQKIDLQPELIKEIPDKTWMEGNTEYWKSVDPDILCQKSEGCDAAVNRLKTVLGDDYNVDMAWEVMARANDNKLPTPCPQCYVWSGRAKSGGAMQKKYIIGLGGYNGEILRILHPASVDRATVEAIRHYSSTDFKAEHIPGLIIEIMQAQARGFPIAGYSKESELATLLGDTGMYLNLSIGRNEVIGMNHKEAFSQRAKYPNVATIFVGFNDVEILNALRNPNVDHVIPWHASGQKVKNLAATLGDPSITNYTSEQNETVINENGRRVKAAEDKRIRDRQHRGDLDTYLKLVKKNKVTKRFPDLYEQLEASGDEDLYMKLIGPEYGKFQGAYPYMAPDVSKINFAAIDPIIANRTKSVLTNQKDYLNIADDIIKDFESGTLEFGQRKIESGPIETDTEVLKQQPPIKLDVTKFAKPDIEFFSPLTVAIEKLQQETFTPEQLKAVIGKAEDVRQEELDDLGINEWLDGIEGKVTKTQALEFIENNKPQISEVVKGEPGIIKRIRKAKEVAPVEEVKVTGTVELFKDKETGKTIGTGRPVKAVYVHNLEKSPDMGERFGQHLEPSGKYMTLLSDQRRGEKPLPNFERGDVDIENPLVLEWNTEEDGGYDNTGWKARLSKAYSGKTGQKLSQALIDDGYDAVITVVKKDGKISHVTETVLLVDAKAEPISDFFRKEIVEEVSIEADTEMQELDNIFRERIAEIKADTRLSDTQKDLLIKQTNIEYAQARNELFAESKAKLDEERVQESEVPLDLTERVGSYIDDLRKTLSAHENLEDDRQVDEVKTWLTEELELMDPKEKLAPEQLLDIKTTPEKIKMSFSEYIIEKFKVREHGKRGGRREAMKNIHEVQQELVSYIREQQLPMPLKSKLLVPLKDLSGLAKESTQWDHLKKAIAKVDKVLEDYKVNVAREELRNTVKDINKRMAQLSPELKALAEATLDGFNEKSTSENTQKALTATLKFIEQPNKNREGLLKELGWTEEEASTFLQAEEEAITDTALQEAVSRLRKDKVSSSLIDRMNTLSRTDLADMDIEDIKIINATLESIMHQQNTMNQLRDIQARRAVDRLKVASTDKIGQKKDASDPLASDPVFKRLKKLGGKKAKQALQLYRQYLLTPSAIAFIMDGYVDNGPMFKALVKPFREGYGRQYEVQRDSDTALDDFLKKEDIEIKGFDSRKGQKGTPYTLDNKEKIILSKNERIALYLHAQNSGNLRHLLTSGFVLSDDLKKKKPYQLTHNDLSNILADMSVEEVKIANQVSLIYDTILAPFINKTSRKLNGYNLAEVAKYFPIVSSGLHAKYLNNSFGADATMDNMNALNNFIIEAFGFLKARQEGSNAIVVDDVFRTFNRSVNDVGRYYGFAEPLRNTKAFLRGAGSNGKSIEGVINEKFHQSLKFKKGQQFKDPAYWSAIKDIPKDIEQAKRPDELRDATNAILNNVTRGVLGMNPGVAVLQTVSYGAARNEIPYEYWKVGADIISTRAATYEEMGKWSPTLWARGKGMMSIAFGEAAMDKAGRWGMSMIQRMDREAIGRIWRASEAWVKAERPDLKGDDFYKEVARRTEHVVSETQPTFEQIDRPMAARSKHFVGQVLMRYSSQLLKNYAINFKNEQAWWNRSEGDRLSREAGGKMLGHVLLNRVILPLIVSLIRMGRNDIRDEIMDMLNIYKRDDEEESSFIIRLLQGAAGANIASQGQIANKLLGMISGYRSEDPLSAFENKLLKWAVDATKVATQYANNEKYDKNGKDYRKNDPKWVSGLNRLLYNGAGLFNITGLPVKNAAEMMFALAAMALKINRDIPPWIEGAYERMKSEERKEVDEEEREKMMEEFDKQQASGL